MDKSIAFRYYEDAADESDSFKRRHNKCPDLYSQLLEITSITCLQ